MITREQWAELLRIRAAEPQLVTAAYQRRRRRPRLLSERGTLFLVAADHPARGDIGIRSDPLAMADRRSLLERLLVALANPAVDGVLGTPDVIEELLLLDEITGFRALDDRVVIGSMNRGGLADAEWGIDDRFTAYSAQSIVDCNLDGGKMLLRLVDTDAATAPTIESCARAVTELATARRMAMVEPLPYERGEDGALRLMREAGPLARAASIAAGLGHTSAYTWLKLPAPAEPEVVFGSSSLPVLVLGGVPVRDTATDLAAWQAAVAHPAVRGLVVGRALLYPSDGDVAAAVAAAASLLAQPAPVG
ncbi:hypothetical protein GCM10012275_20630 [Longimycelium tulufanense]|uniref:Cgl0159-like domain-containing protein n=1 Tax=Longimycelium tulufanense TaxID=907463 RepID=A0A8J3FUC9_9PSEU|nr:aldolase [Longimycelium tulufanense]GGM49608.1 hypothetical protein GCM10012275_20630 [Longimycelium tulufanense]